MNKVYVIYDFSEEAYVSLDKASARVYVDKSIRDASKFNSEQEAFDFLVDYAHKLYSTEFEIKTIVTYRGY